MSDPHDAPIDNGDLHDDEGNAGSGHAPVLVGPILVLLAPQPGQTMLDCTAGRGGHAVAITPRLAPNGRYIGLDLDPDNVAHVRERLEAASAEVAVDVVKANFADARVALNALNINKVDLLLADLGFASTQMDDASRGFSFMRDGPLDMRLDPTQPTTAADLVNGMGQADLADLIYEFGEERRSRRIAQKIVEARVESPINTTARLAQIVRGVYHAAHARHRTKAKRSSRGRSTGSSRHDPATRTFQALRIAVNGELDALRNLLDNLPDLLASHGRAAIVSFHSLEDRMVKRAFAELDKRGVATRLNRKVVTADEAELATNPRSRSAKLRAIRFN